MHPFDLAFLALDSHGHNLVSLAALRIALGISRGAFDAVVSVLRRQGRYSLTGSDQAMTQQERDAAIVEGERVLVFVSQRKTGK